MSPVIASKVIAVIFADGEFRGEDSHQFQANVEHHMQSMRQSWQMAKAGNWTGLKAKAEDDNESIFGATLARRLLDTRAKSGDDAAVNLLAYFGNLPASTWKSGLLNRLRVVPDAFQAIAQWIMPTASSRLR